VALELSLPRHERRGVDSASALLFLVIFVEGFASLGIEVIALRRLVPFVGSSIAVTAPTIGLFLAALALGYWSGGRIGADYLARVARNFLAAALIAGVGLSSLAVTLLFGGVGHTITAYVLFMLFIVCPSAWLLAQTVPLLTNVIEETRRERAGAASGWALTASTAGSVVGALSLSLIVMQWLSVSAAVLACAVALCIGSLAARQRPARAPVAGLLVAVLAWFNLAPQPNALESAYADYRVGRVQEPADLPPGGHSPARVFMVNGQWASLLDGSQPPRRAAYIERMHRLLIDELRFAGKNVLVLGAGGFTLSLRDQTNRYTYVDIDPNIRPVAEREFLHQPIAGDFVVDDARHFVTQTPRRFDAVVVDVYSAHASVPGHLVTAEFWRTLPRVLNDDGLVLVNLVGDSALRSAYVRNTLATIERELGRCAVEVLDRSRPVSNIGVYCQPTRQAAGPVHLYTDERNAVDLDRGLYGF
jgi:predicted membrane-bound spermidine synthase